MKQVKLSRGTSLVLILCLARTASAESPYRLEAFGGIGAAHYLDIASTIFGGPGRGTSPNYGAGFGIRPFAVDRGRLLRMLGGEFEVNATRSSVNGVKSTQSYFTGSILLHASIGDVEPYFLLGGGVSRSGETYRAGNVGVGAKIFVTPRVSLRPEFRAFFTEYIGNFGRASFAVGYHW
jgi:hypothetical protein